MNTRRLDHPAGRRLGRRQSAEYRSASEYAPHTLGIAVALQGRLSSTRKSAKPNWPENGYRRFCFVTDSRSSGLLMPDMGRKKTAEAATDASFVARG